MKSYAGKYFSVYGDSLSTLEGFVPPQNAVYYTGEESERSGVRTYEDTWWGQVIDTLGGKLLKNNSWSGCLVTDPYDMGVESSGCHPDRLSSLGDGDIQPDVILIFMGTNDRGYRLPVYRERGNSITYFSGAYAYMLAQLASLYPAAERWCITLRQSGKSRPTAEHPVTDGYSQAIRDCAAAAGCRLIDLAACPPYDVFDPYAIHASAQGMKDISHAVLTTAMGWTE